MTPSRNYLLEREMLRIVTSVSQQNWQLGLDQQDIKNVTVYVEISGHRKQFCHVNSNVHANAKPGSAVRLLVANAVTPIKWSQLTHDVLGQ